KYLPSFEIGFNTGGFDWNFMLKKIHLLNIEKEISQILEQDIINNIRETKIKVYEKDIDEKMQRKIYRIETKKTFPTEIKNILDVVLKCCELSGKVDLPYIPDLSEDLLFSRRKGDIIEEKYNDGLVLNPRKNPNNRPVADIDFTSYYPNTIITNNISLNTCVNIDSQEENLNVIIDNGIVYGKFRQHNNKKTKMGLMPLISKMLLVDWAIAKKNMKKAKNKQKYSYYNSLQNALKTIANSIYGETGYRYSPFYLKYVSSSVTGFARSNLKRIIQYAEQK
ncbi:15489_t:CDS:2, partial [Racocetra fulgida]